MIDMRTLLGDAIAATESRTTPSAPSSGGGATVIQSNNNLGPGGMSACAGLNVHNGKVALAYVGDVPWHRLGTQVQKAMSSDDAMRLAHLAGWSLEKVQQFCDWNGIRLETDKHAIVRTDVRPAVVLGSVGSQYEIVTNEECFQFMDALGSDIRYDVAGALGNGERVWMLADMPKAAFSVGASDEMRVKVLCATSHDGSGAITIFPTTVRPICANTLRLAMSGRRGKGICLRHTKNVSDRVDDAREALGMIADQASTFKAQAEVLAASRLEPLPYFNGCLDHILDTTVAGQKVTGQSIESGAVLDSIVRITDSAAKLKAESAYHRATKRRGGLLDDILERYETDRCAGDSAWSAYNAVSESIDHGDVLRFQGSERKRAESRFESLVSGRGDELKQAAMTMAVDAVSQAV